MPIRLTPKRLQNRSLVFRLFLGQDYIVEIDGLRAGWVLTGVSSTGKQIWWWTMTGPSCGVGRINNVSQCNSLEEAKSEFRQAFEKWMDWASDQAQPVVWFGTSSDAIRSPGPKELEQTR
jgi:hypothetical protein